MTDKLTDTSTSLSAAQEPSATGSHVDLSRMLSGMGVPSHTGLDPMLTKLAVELQAADLHDNEMAIRVALAGMRELLQADSVFVALFDERREHIANVRSASSVYASCNPEVLTGESIPSAVALCERLDAQRLLEVRSTALTHSLGSGLAELVSRIATLQISSVLIAGVLVQGRAAGFMGVCATHPRTGWDADVHLMLKLLSASYASGLERARMRSEFAYLQSRNDLAMHSGHDGLWDLDFERGTLYLSPRWKAMLGYDDEELIDVKDWRQFVHPDDNEPVERQLREHLAGQAPLFEATYRVLHRSGEWRWVTARAKAKTDANGKLLRLVGV
jgi:PAS domain S-box-containing protein